MILYKRWMLETREAGMVISRAFFHTEEQAERERQKREDEHIGVTRAYNIVEQDIEI